MRAMAAASWLRQAISVLTFEPYFPNIAACKSGARSNTTCLSRTSEGDQTDRGDDDSETGAMIGLAAGDDRLAGATARTPTSSHSICALEASGPNCRVLCRAPASGRMVERNEMSLENRRGPLGPSGVRIPPPPLTTRIASNDAGTSKKEAGLKP